MNSATLRYMLRLILLTLVSGLLLACSGDKGTGPVEVKWDRDVCDRCRMVLSDRFHAAQIRGGPAGQKAKVYKFDDFGCAVLWLDEQPWKDQPMTEFWVTDYHNGHWLEARHAFYVTGHTTAMEYGLGAQPESGTGTLTYEQAAEQVRRIEAQYNVHGTHLERDVQHRR